MKWALYFGIALRIIILFGVGMLGTYIPDYLRGFFGDVYDTYENGYDPDWNWGARHYWYFYMMLVLFVLSAINVLVSVYNMIKKHYPNAL